MRSAFHTSSKLLKAVSETWKRRLDTTKNEWTALSNGYIEFTRKSKRDFRCVETDEPDRSILVNDWICPCACKRMVAPHRPPIKSGISSTFDPYVTHVSEQTSHHRLYRKSVGAPKRLDYPAPYGAAIVCCDRAVNAKNPSTAWGARRLASQSIASSSSIAQKSTNLRSQLLNYYSEVSLRLALMRRQHYRTGRRR